MTKIMALTIWDRLMTTIENSRGMARQYLTDIKLLIIVLVGTWSVAGFMLKSWAEEMKSVQLELRQQLMVLVVDNARKGAIIENMNITIEGMRREIIALNVKIDSIQKDNR